MNTYIKLVVAVNTVYDGADVLHGFEIIRVTNSHAHVAAATARDGGLWPGARTAAPGSRSGSQGVAVASPDVAAAGSRQQ